MLAALLATVSAVPIRTSIASLPRDDTYHEFVVNSTNGVSLWVQPWPDHAAILCVHHENYNFTADTEDPVTGKWTSVQSTLSDRTEGYKETRFPLTSENPVVFRVNCVTAFPCPMVLNYVHTDPVYRPSAVIGAFSLFVCLFLFVFSLTLFCGACRATRKT
jgi:hypothetical protein